MYPIITYQDTFIEQAEWFLRSQLYPFYRDTLRPILVFFQVIYDNLICWFNAIQYWLYGIVRFVVFPVFKNCDIQPTFNAALVFINTVIQDFFIDYFLGEKYFYGPCDFTNVTATGINAWLEWVKLYSCTCNDLSDLLKKLPIFPGFIPVLGLTSWFSLQWADPFMWKGIEYAVDGFMEILNQLLRLAIQGIHAIYLHIDPQGPYAEANFTRPDFYLATDYFVNSTDNIIISYENAIQLFWDMYIPFPFDFHGYFCWLQALISFLLKTANFMVTMLINIDKLLQYPMNYFWSTTARGLITENLNLVGVPSPFAPVTVYYAPNVTAYTMSNWYLPEDQKWIYPLWTNASLNPLYQKKRMSQCFCEFLTRTFCDPTNNGTACFPNSLLSTFDFCCLTNNATTIVLDLTTSVVELSYHTALGGDDIVLFFTNQPFAKAIVDTMISIVKCLFSLLTLIPEVGVPLQNFFTEGIAYWIRFFYFISIALVDVATLPFYNEFLPLENATIEQTGYLLNLFTSINDQLVADTPTSFVNSMCLILNNGFPIPPVPCLNCTPGGFVPIAKRSAAQRLTDALGWSSPESAYRVTPIWYYGNSTKIDFSEMGKRIWMNSPKNNPIPEDINSYVDEKKNEFLSRWTQTLTCAQLKEEARLLQKTKPHIYRRRKIQGRYDCDKTEKPRNPLEIEPGSPADIASGGGCKVKRDSDPYPPPVATCDANTECFDLCCFNRAVVNLYAQTMNFIARIFNGFVQYQAWRYPGVTADFPYFTGESHTILNTDSFETDLIKEVMLFFKLPICLCNFLNLVVPQSMLNPRNNICCSIQKLSDLISSLIMVIINATQNVVYGAADNYTYFRDGFFKRDVDVLFEIAYEFVSCVCELLQFIFPVSYIPGLGSTNIDVCCSARVLMNTAIEIGRFAINTLIAAATFTINPDSYCYFRLDTTAGCGGTLDTIGIVIAMDALLDTIFTIPDPNSQCAQNCPLAGNGAGLAQCACDLITSLVPIRTDPSRGANCSLSNLNCDLIDLCCFFNQQALTYNLLGKFSFRAVIALIQSWAGGLPEFFINYIACDENAGTVPCGGVVSACSWSNTMNNTAKCGCGTYTCGKLNPVIKAFTSTLSKCLCVFLGLLDDYISMVFTAVGGSWSNCFCGTQQANGYFQTLSAASYALFSQVAGLFRQIALPCYWNPNGISETYIGNTPVLCNVTTTPGCYCKFTKIYAVSVRDSWVFSFISPIVEAQCASVGKLFCFLTSIFFLKPQCNNIGQRFLGSIVVWSSDMLVRTLGIFEGIVRQYTDPVLSCVGPNPSCTTSDKITFQGFRASNFIGIITSFLDGFADIFVGDSAVACSRVCPTGIIAEHTCDCYRRSPNFGALNITHGSVWVESTYLSVESCLIAYQPTWAVGQTQYKKGLNGVSGQGAQHPICTAVKDYPTPASPGYPGICQNYSMCRPDSLPICGLPSGAPPSQSSSHDSSPVDGILIGLFRLIRCILPEDAKSASEFYDFGVWMCSIIWQLYGPTVRVIVSIVFVFFSFFNGDIRNCSCYTSPDPNQNNLLVKYTLGQGANAGFCYPCPDANAGCGLTDEQIEAVLIFDGRIPNFSLLNTTVIQTCEPQCPVWQINATSNAEALAACYKYMSINSSPSVLSGGGQTTAQISTYCDGTFEENIIYQNCNLMQNVSFTSGQQQCYNEQKLQWFNDAYKQQSCHIPFCQRNGSSTFVNTRRTTSTGSTENANPVIPCGVLGFFLSLGEVFDAIFDLFSTPWLAPQYRNIMMKENRSEFRQRSGVYRTKRTAVLNVPHAILVSLYGYDTTDCFSDPVGCLCRNFHMPHYCTWDSFSGTVIPTPGRKIFEPKWNTTTKRNLGDISFDKNEAYMMISERFDGTTVCDHTIQTIASDGIIGQSEEEAWVKCVDKRIQSERLSEVSGGMFPPDYAYNTKGIVMVYENVAQNFKERISERLKTSDRRRMLSKKQKESVFPDFDTLLEQRRKDGAEYLIHDLGIPKNSIMFPMYLDLDQIYAKYATGYYSYLLTSGFNNYRHGISFFPSFEESLVSLQFAVHDLKATYYNTEFSQVYSRVWNIVNLASESFFEIKERGFVNTITDLKKRFDDHINHIHKRSEEKREKTLQKWRHTPLYQWWYAESPPETRLDKTTFFKHISNVMAYRRAQRESQPSVVKQFKSRFVPQWTEEQLQNWRKAGNVFRTLRSYIYPSEYTDSALVERGNERFLVDGDCQLFNALANYSINLFTPCLAQQVRNTRALQGGRLEYYVNNVVPYYRGNYERKSITRHLKMDENMTYWKRWKTIDQPLKVVRKRVDHRVYKRAIASYNTGPAGFNLYDWAVAVLETWFNFLFTQDLNTWIDDAKAWISNPNTDYADFLAQNVGLSYWALFMIRCNIPENTNCVGGIGLGPAILWVGLGLIGLAIVSAFVLPVIAQVLAVLPVTIISIIIIFTIGLHYSPRCAVLGISPTIFSFVLPECLMDQIIQILDDLITNCYSPKYLPSCMIAGDLCPVDPNQYIDWLNCQVVGVSDGIQNVLFLGSITLGQPFMNVFLYVSQTTFGHWMPGLQEYMQTTLDGFKYAGPSQNCRQWWCFGLTFPAIALPLFLIILGVLVLGFIVPFVFALLLTTYSFWATSPAAIILPGSDEAQAPDFPEPQEQEQEENLDPVDKAKLDNMQCDIENARAFLRNYQE